MKLVVHAAYSFLAEPLSRLPQEFQEQGEVIYEGRNELRRIQMGKEDLIVKSFQVPHLINRIAYSFFRPSKAKRSYEYSLRLQEKGIQAAEPVAYIEEKRFGLFSTSYYVSLFCDYPGLMRELAYHPLAEVKELVTHFARFTAHLHQKEVLHLDYSSGNILYKKVDEEYHFCLVDINRMKFEAVSMDTACFNFRRLWGSDETLIYFATTYAQARGFDESECVKLTMKYRQEFWENYTKKYPEKKPYRC